MSRFTNSWSLLGSSWQVLKSDKELTVIPVASTVTTLAVAGAFGAAAYFTMGEQPSSSGGYELTVGPLTYVIGAIGYLVVTVLVTFFTAALVSGAHQRLTGQDPSLGSAFSGATQKLPQIVAWGLLTGTVGLVLQAIRDRLGPFGDIVTRLVGMAWDIVTWLAVPVIVVEGPGPIDALKRAAKLFGQTWGENLIAQVGFGAAGFVLMLPVIIVGGALSFVLPIVGIPLLILGVIVVAIVLSTLSGIYRTALYIYASSGQPPAQFEQSQLAGAFRPKGAA